MRDNNIYSVAKVNNWPTVPGGGGIGWEVYAGGFPSCGATINIKHNMHVYSPLFQTNQSLFSPFFVKEVYL